MRRKLDAMRYLDAIWVDHAAVGRIMRETGLDLHEDFKLLDLQNFLNDLIGQSIGVQLDALRGKDEWQQAAMHLDAVVRYQEFAAEWSKSGQILPRIPPATLSSIISHRDRIQHDMENGSNRLRKRKGAWDEYFYPRILALYAVAFGRLPRAIPPRVIDSRKMKDVRVTQADPAVRFVATVLREVHFAQDTLGYKKMLEEAGLGDASWSVMELDSVASRMREHMRARDHQSPSHVLWEGARDEYLMRVNALKKNK